MNNQKIAKIGEKLGVRHLINKKYSIIDCNVRYGCGEIDIIAEIKNLLVFVEVKTRTNWKFGYPEQAMDYRKKQRFESAIFRHIFLKDYEGDWRADLIAIDLRGKKAELRHYQGIEL